MSSSVALESGFQRCAAAPSGVSATPRGDDRRRRTVGTEADPSAGCVGWEACQEYLGGRGGSWQRCALERRMTEMKIRIESAFAAVPASGAKGRADVSATALCAVQEHRPRTLEVSGV